MAQSTQPFQLPLRRCLIGVAGQNTVQRQFEGPMDALACRDVVLVENFRSDVRAEGGSGEEIAAEEQAVCGGVETAVTVGVAGQGHDAETAPDGKLVTIAEKLVGAKGGHAEQAAADPFGDAGDTAPAGVTGSVLEVFEVALRSGDPGVVFAGEGRCVEDVIEVPMREQDAADGQMIPAAGLEGCFQCVASSEEAGVDQVQRVTVPQDEELHDEGADDEEIGRHGGEMMNDEWL